MIYTLTLNPAMDYYIYVDSFSEGELNFSKKAIFFSGGKGINVSMALKNLGLESVALGYTGGITGAFIKNDLKRNGIESYFIEISDDTRLNLKINNSGKETEISGIPPEISDRDIDLLFDKLKCLTENDILVLSGSIPNGVCDTVYKKISSCVKSRVSLDTRGYLIKKNMSGYFLIKPNIKELEEMFGKTLHTDEEIMRECEYFLDAGVENVIVSKGGDGALIVTKELRHSATAPKGRLISSVGAGDSMIAGFLYGIHNKRSVLDSFKISVACGSATAFSHGLAKKEAVDKLLNGNEIVINTISF